MNVIPDEEPQGDQNEEPQAETVSAGTIDVDSMALVIEEMIGELYAAQSDPNLACNEFKNAARQLSSALQQLQTKQAADADA